MDRQQDHTDLLEILNHIDPSYLSYQDWVNVGMALKESGFSADDWDRWSRSDPSRYHSGECEKKWASFVGSAAPVTSGTIVQMAAEQGWMPTISGQEIGWDDTIEKDELTILNPAWIEGKDVIEPENWHPAQQLITYLETLFDSTENVGYVTESWENADGKFVPTKGCWDRTAGELIQALDRCGEDIGAVLGDYKPEVGAWIRFNPLDGKGIRNDNVTDFRYALVESDNMEIEKQNAIIRELELPVACLVYSGKKSLHAIVRVEASDYSEYRKRVDYLYNVCKKNGLELDQQNRNPSRLSRIPGVMRSGHKQFLLDTNIGKPSWDEWKEWIESVNDDLPDPESMADAWDNLPELAPALIDGVLRQGHKMLMSGPSKAGKSFALIELCCSIAEGKTWLGFNCAQGRVLYVNLELDRASCLHRFKDVYAALGYPPEHLKNIDIWNLRGKSIPMDKLAPKLIRRASKKDYIAVVIDPIYKVITGDENSADQMANFCNQFDKICTTLSCAVIYCHHHSKGAQGDKRSMDRASGSGVFARDPDALLDLIELEVPDALHKQEENKAVCKVCQAWLEKYVPSEDLNREISQDDMCSEKAMLGACRGLLQPDTYQTMLPDIDAARKAVQACTAWRVEGTLREFPKFPPINLWFDYPIHKIDSIGVLHDIQPETDQPAWKRAISKRKPKEEKAKDRKQALETAFEACSINDKITISDIAEYMGVTEKTARNRIKEHGDFWVDGSEVGKKTEK
ncbi:MAG: AAA family ATPase [Oscillospiraceae bacterium]|nr:AAA family ATPase [Oscillospiraceae bacterium]